MFFKIQLENDRMRFNPAKMCVMLLMSAALLPVTLRVQEQPAAASGRDEFGWVDHES